MVLTNGTSVADFNHYYDLTSKQGDTLYAYMNFGACALSFIPGLCYDSLGCMLSMVLGTLIFDAGLLLQLVWTDSFPAWLSTMHRLEFCYICFGFASSFFNVIGSFAPLVAYPSKDVGKVSACVQVCMSLGITVQSQIYYALKRAVGTTRVVKYYLVYALIFTNVTGLFMCISFRVCRKILAPPHTSDSVDEELPKLSLGASLRLPEFIYFLLFFFIAIGFSFSFLNVESRIIAEAGIQANPLIAIFGVLNAFGRLSVSVPLDYTRQHLLGGIFSYLIASIAFFMIGIILLVVPSSASGGYGGMLGLVPLALRQVFGNGNLGLIYGLLYVAAAISEPLWSALFVKLADCSGVGCYRTYCLSCVCGFLAMLCLTVVMLLRDIRKRRSRITSQLAVSLCKGTEA